LLILPLKAEAYHDFSGERTTTLHDDIAEFMVGHYLRDQPDLRTVAVLSHTNRARPADAISALRSTFLLRHESKGV
jgi:hypothetical protein